MREREEFSKLASIARCPICGEELEKGYIGASRGITWDVKKSKRIFVYIWSSALILPFSTQNIPALRCKKCRLALFHYGKEMPLETSKSYLKTCVECGKEIPLASEECEYCGTKQPEKGAGHE
jgi:hypothetical protein